MSGSKQHYIPRLLLRSFRNNPRGKISRVHVYRSDRDYLSPVEDVASQRFFYSGKKVDREEILDDLITRYENDLANDLRQIEKVGTGAVDAPIAARIVVHLLFRSDHVRGVMRSGIAQVSDLIQELFGSDEKIAVAIGIDGASPGPHFDALFDEHLATHPIITKLELPKPVVRSLTYMMLREVLQASFGRFADTIGKVVTLFRDEGPALAREAHNDILLTSLAPKARLDMLETFSWRVERVKSPSFVLPDFVALALSEKGQAASLLGVTNNEVAAVLMPLSPCRMLVGRRNDTVIDLLHFNALAVPNCLSFFVSSFMSPELTALAKTIGSSIAAELNSALKEAATGFRARLEQAPSSADRNKAVTLREPNGNVALVTDCLSPEDANKLCVSLGQLLHKMHEKFDISSLLRVHVAADYDRTLATLDRGTLGASEPALRASEQGLSVAYNVSVEENGKHGVVIVLRDVIALGLLSEDDHLFAAAASIFMEQTARIGTNALLAEVFADGIKTGTACDVLLISYAIPAWKSWIITGYASLFQSEIRTHHREVLVEQLQALRGRLESIRRAYRLHGDVDKLLSEALDEVAQVLATAAVAAASSAFGGTPDTQMDETFSMTLDALGYLPWFELLKADIAKIWNEEDGYPSQDAFLALNRHLEQLLMVGTIFLWEDEGRARVEVPYWLDWEWMAAKLSENANA